MPAQSSIVLVDAEMRKVCDRGHALGWRPWYRSRVGTVLGHCVCGAPYQRETRGPEPLDKRGVTIAGDWVAIEFPKLDKDAERIARIAIRAYLNEVDDA